jgi:hypothetical protein
LDRARPLSAKLALLWRGDRETRRNVKVPTLKKKPPATQSVATPAGFNPGLEAGNIVPADISIGGVSAGQDESQGGATCATILLDGHCDKSNNRQNVG